MPFHQLQQLQCLHHGATFAPLCATCLAPWRLTVAYVLLAKIEGGYLIALESKYHLSCLTKLRKHHRSYLRESGENSGVLIKEQKMEAKAFAELLVHIEMLIEEGAFYSRSQN